ncbi:MAG: hypothetical protein GX610_00715 [Rhodococcus sp.]|nr:hypothetical protein [Rhodococcus sp. (in: high G+C Gram-positive bacteria)]
MRNEIRRLQSIVDRTAAALLAVDDPMTQDLGRRAHRELRHPPFGDRPGSVEDL